MTYEHYDAGSGELTVDHVVESTDSLPIRGPLRVELGRLESSMAPRIEVENADNDMRGTGAVWSIDAGTLASYARSRPRRLVFHPSDGPESARTAGSAARGPKPLLVADLRLLASPSLP